MLEGRLTLMYICWHKRIDIMKFAGFLIAVLIILIGFSMLAFLALFVGYWLTLIGLERVMPSRIYKWLGHEEEAE